MAERCAFKSIHEGPLSLECRSRSSGQFSLPLPKPSDLFSTLAPVAQQKSENDPDAEGDPLGE